MKDWIEEEIKRLEKERDRNLAIHCDYAVSYTHLTLPTNREV